MKRITIYIFAYIVILLIGITLQYEAIFTLYKESDLLEVAKTLVLNKGNLFAMLLLFALILGDILYSYLQKRTSVFFTKTVYLVFVTACMFAALNIVYRGGAA